MDKPLTVNQKRSKTKHSSNNTKKKQHQLPLKIVYITNPIKFNVTASEFRALVQELTGKDADTSESSMFAAASGVSGEELAADDVNSHAVVEEEAKLGHTCDGGEANNGWDPNAFGRYFDCTEHTVGNIPGMASSDPWHEAAADHLDDVFKSLDGFM